MENSKGQVTEKYDNRTGKWSLMSSMNMKRLQCGSALVGNNFYLLGGREGLKTLNTVEAYDWNRQVWTPVTNMNTHRHGLASCYYNGYIYAIGGHVCVNK